MTHHDNTTPHASRDYDAEVRRTIPYYDAFHRETIRLVAALPHPPTRWLDTGCGTGTLAALAGAAFPDTTFLLADPSAAMLAIAEAKCRAAGIIHEVLEPCGTQYLSPQLTGSLDVITAIQAHHYLQPDERRQATQVCYDLLQPGGCYVTFENIHPASDDGIEIGKCMWGASQRDAGRSPETVDKHLQRFGVDYFPITIDEHLRLLRASGFRVVELLWHSCMQAGFYAIK